MISLHIQDQNNNNNNNTQWSHSPSKKEDEPEDSVEFEGSDSSQELEEMEVEMDGGREEEEEEMEIGIISFSCFFRLVPITAHHTQSRYLPGHFTSMKYEFGLWTSRFSLCFALSSSEEGWSKSLASCGNEKEQLQGYIDTITQSIVCGTL